MYAIYVKSCIHADTPEHSLKRENISVRYILFFSLIILFQHILDIFPF